MKDFYDEMMLRNWAFITPKEQEKVKNTKILLAGCGLGSNIAELAVETGFTKFVLVDGDKVEVSNLNRQAFDKRHVGKNKAEALKSILEEKSEAVEIEAFPEMITPGTARKYVSKADIVVNLVDFDETVYILNEVAKKQDKLSITSLNIGWVEGFSLVFSPESATLEDMTGGRIVNDETRFFESFTRSIKGYQLPDYFMKDFERIMRIRAEKGYNPQLGIGALMTSATVVLSIIRSVVGASLVFAPEAITVAKLYNIDQERKSK